MFHGRTVWLVEDRHDGILGLWENFQLSELNVRDNGMWVL